MNTRNAFAYLTGEKKLDYKVAASVALQGAEEGIVLLKNNNKALPLSRGVSVAFFGRMQKEYIHMGTGSGGKCTRRWENFTVIRNLNDIVTHVPPAILGYSHVGTVLEIGIKGRYTPIEAHYEENILAMLAEYEAYLKISMETAFARGSSETKTNSLSPATKEISR